MSCFKHCQLISFCRNTTDDGKAPCIYFVKAIYCVLSESLTVMIIRTKQSYHPFNVVAFYLHILPDKLLTQIPRSTLYDWQHKSVIELFGYDWYCQNQHLFTTLQEVAISKQLLKVNRALLRIIAIQRFLQLNTSHIRHKILNVADSVSC